MADQQYQSYAEPLADGPYLPAWQPQSVDQVPRRTLLPVALIVATAFVSVVEPIPGAENARAAAVIGGNDVIRRAPIVQYIQLAGPVLVPAAAQPAPDRSWAPIYPDRLSPRVGLEARQQQAYAAPVSPSSQPELRWDPEYPERVRARLTLRSAGQQFLAFYPVPPAAVVEPDPLSWLGVYPAAAPQIPEPVAVRAYLFAFVDTEPVIVIQPIADQRWRPSSPDLLTRPTVTPDQQQAFAFYPVPVAAPVVAELSWAPEHPDWLARPRFRVALQQAYAANVDPIATAAFVPLSWAPEFPDHLARRLQRLLGGAVLAPEAQTVVAFLDWLATYPDRFARVVRPLAPTIVVPPALAAGALADALSCIHLSQIEVTHATLLVQAVAQATILTEAIRDDSPLSVRVC